MKVKRGAAMRSATLLLCLIVGGVSCQENAIKNLSPSLLECYDGDTYAKWNLLPHNMETLIAIIRKIEDSPGLNMDLRKLSTSILHRFRQDGIVRNPRVKAQAGIMPYAPLGKQFFRHAQTLRVIPGNAVTFPNDSISALERCTLHSMLSSSIDIFERGDESRVCKVANYAYRRYGRSADLDRDERNLKEEVETLTDEQLEMMSKADMVDPNSLYPALPPNHPGSARLTDLPPYSRCPTENGVVRTRWGSVSGGSVLAGIAAGLTPQQIKVGDLIRQTEQRVTSYSSDASVLNKFLGTLAGDLAEVALLQGPQLSERYILGVEGNWNSSSQPLYYFLSGNENLEMTAAEVRGDLDGLILANELPNYYPGRIGGLRLSQVLDMYYGDRGLFDRANRACNRRAHLHDVAPTPILTDQTHNSAIILSSGIATATFSSEAIQKFATQAVNDLGSLVPTMNSDSCDVGASGYDGTSEPTISEPAVDLTVILDTTWPYETVKPIISQLLSGLSISKYNSNVTIVNGQDGSILLHSTHDPNEFYHLFNLTSYEKLSRGFELSRSLEKLRLHQTNKLNEEQREGRAGGKSDVVLFLPYQSNAPQGDKEYCLSTIKTMQEEVPDAVILFLTYGSKDRWGEYVREPNNDLFSVSIGETTESYPAVDSLQTRIRQIPRRLVNTQCDADYQSTGSSKALIETVVPGGTNYYRIHPNYFSSDDTENPPRIKIQGSGLGSLRVCTSRQLLHANASETAASADCSSHTLTMNCEGASYLHQCEPYYVSISSNSTGPSSFGCNDPKLCRYPDSVRYTISFENLVCKSSGSALLAAPLIVLFALAQQLLHF